MIKRLKEKAF